MYKALVIGCGNIGAGYDFDNEQVLTHAKALSLNKNFTLTVYDTDKELAFKVRKKYSCEAVEDIDVDSLSKFDCVSICSPTGTHFKYLSAAIDAKVKVIVCEKPVSSNAEELPKLIKMYKSGSSKIMVNYTRRFQPAYSELKYIIADLLKKEKLTNISIRYQRGFINNCSHAADLIEFLIGKNFDLTDIKKSNPVTDHFENDPTLSMMATLADTNVNVLGLSNVLFPYFDINFFFNSTKIEIKELGRTIEILKADEPFTVLSSKKIFQNCMKDNMIHVISKAEELLNDKNVPDNFIGSVELNQRMLNYLNN
jgi:predicted dehydrogenase